METAPSALRPCAEVWLEKDLLGRPCLASCITCAWQERSTIAALGPG